MVMCFMSISNGFSMGGRIAGEFKTTMHKSHERILITENLMAFFEPDFFDTIEENLRKIDTKKFPDATSFFEVLNPHLSKIEQQLLELAKQPFTTKKVMRKRNLERYGNFYYDDAGYLLAAPEDDDTPEGPCYVEMEAIDGGGEEAALMAQEIHALRDKIRKSLLQ